MSAQAPGLAAAAIAEAYRAACRAELAAIKPGNVHVHAAGHRMSVADFEASAALSAPHVAAPGARVGARAEAAVAATRTGVGQNTNLGIVLLCAPLARAAERPGPWTTTAVHLAFLTGFPDSHVARKFGAAAAETVRAEAEAALGRLVLGEGARAALLTHDAALKAAGLNPGTSADLTVATLFLDALQNLKLDCQARAGATCQ